ncbi:MAG TPA: response regulator [Solirubrobacteraceae bacterium]|nr:response regulator [Solirubrobacteraceae bacterium]
MGKQRGDSVRGLATILFTDIVGSTPLAADLGDRRWLALLGKHHDAVRACLKRHGGVEARVVGDGFVAVFDSPTRSICAALDMHDAIEKLDLSLRAGIHVGEADVAELEPSGLAMHIGARVGALAGAGETLVTSTVRDLCAGADVVFNDRGLHALRGVPGEWHVFEVDRAETARSAPSKAPRGAAKKPAKPKPAAQKPGTKPISLMLVDDHPMWRETLRKVLERSKVGTVVAEAGDGREALELARAARPDVVLMDMHMPNFDGVEATKALATDMPDVKVLVLSSADDRDQVLAALRAGASGYLLKTAASKDVIDGVRRVHAGELVFPPALASLVLQELRGGSAGRSAE